MLSVPLGKSDGQTNSSLIQNYTNPDFNVKLQYPANWTAQEVNLGPNQVVFLFPDDFKGEYSSSVGLTVNIFTDNSFASFDEYFEYRSQFYNGLEDVRIINESTTTLAGRPAYNITYYDYSNNKNFKALDISTYVDDEDFILDYYAEPGYFDKYLPEAKRIMNSFQITNTTN